MKFLSYIESPVLFKEKHLYSDTLPTKYQIKLKKKEISAQQMYSCLLK